jgi:hypothetical protein
MTETDPEIRALGKDAHRASEKLVSRLENYGGGLVPSRPAELAAGDDLAEVVLFTSVGFVSGTSAAGTFARCSRTLTFGVFVRTFRPLQTGQALR